jgi:hypothetical protein
MGVPEVQVRPSCGHVRPAPPFSSPLALLCCVARLPGQQASGPPGWQCRAGQREGSMRASATLRAPVSADCGFPPRPSSLLPRLARPPARSLAHTAVFSAALCMLCSGSAVRARKPGDWCLADRKAPLCSTRGLSWFDSNSTSQRPVHTCDAAAFIAAHSRAAAVSHVSRSLVAVSPGNHWVRGWCTLPCGKLFKRGNTGLGGGSEPMRMGRQ